MGPYWVRSLVKILTPLVETTRTGPACRVPKRGVMRLPGGDGVGALFDPADIDIHLGLEVVDGLPTRIQVYMCLLSYQGNQYSVVSWFAG